MTPEKLKKAMEYEQRVRRIKLELKMLEGLDEIDLRSRAVFAQTFMAASNEFIKHVKSLLPTALRLELEILEKKIADL